MFYLLLGDCTLTKIKIIGNPGKFLIRVGAKEILNELDKGPKRFNELFRLIRFRTPATLSYRLKELMILGFIKRRAENIPGKQIIIWYEITETGRKALEYKRELENLISSSRIQS